MFENIRADLDRKDPRIRRASRRSNFFRKRITPFLEFGTFAVIVYRFGRWAYSIKIPVLRQLLIFIYLVVNTIRLHAHRHPYPAGKRHRTRVGCSQLQLHLCSQPRELATVAQLIRV